MRKYRTFADALNGYVRYGALYAPERLVILTPSTVDHAFYLEHRKKLDPAVYPIGSAQCLLIADFNLDQLSVIRSLLSPDLFADGGNG